MSLARPIAALVALTALAGLLSPAGTLQAATAPIAVMNVGKPTLHFAWPTPSPGLRAGADIAEWIQDTGTGDPHSGLFGCVRDDMHRFHEGIDIKCVERDQKDQPLDSIFAAMDGRVAYINRKPGNSNYGNYIVLEHLLADVPVYTLYAHLASIEPGLEVGQQVKAGTVIARLGHTGTENIPLARAHMHFEIGLRLTNTFQPWYDSKKFGSPNEHGDYNGYNLIGSDPMVFLNQVRSGKFKNFADYFRGLPTAFTLRVSTTRVPDFATRYPALLTKPVPKEGVAGWDVQFTWYGLPKQLTPLSAGMPGLGKPGVVSIVSFDRAVFTPACSCRETLIFSSAKNSIPKIGTYLDDVIKLMFGYK